ncbi:MAG: sigma-54 dependent transcriptional regulator [Pirellulaceae bacterium]|jgi:two-component system NtrC family response regulator|nr:sigma-54 dependent transcriptional regulator [Pirellulaceae bacterium]
MKKKTKDDRKPPRSLRILFADDEAALQELMSLELPRMGHEVTVCPDGATAAAALERNAYDCLLVDLDMPGLNGIQVIQRAKELAPDTEAVVLTGKSSLDSAIAALRFGAFDYLTKPCRLIELQALLERVAQKRELTNKYRALKRQLERLEGTPRLIGDGPAMQRVRQLIQRVAPTSSTVLVLGETGTGKELVARAVHDQSLRAEMPFVAINCGALPENLIESELFGHRRGAFTGAEEHRIGLFEVAHGGTLFLDEIGELPKAMQAKLLRVLESGEMRRVGDNESFQVDVRIVCATHRDLEEMVSQQQFREDLMFRLNTFEIPIPPLRERLSDIPALAVHLVRRFRPSAHGAAEGLFSPDALQLLRNYPWPGNVRELANVIEHATILADELPIRDDHLPDRLSAPRTLRLPGRSSLPPRTLRELELQAIDEALERHQGNKPAAADELGISLKTLYNKLNQASQLEKSA